MKKLFFNRFNKFSKGVLYKCEICTLLHKQVIKGQILDKVLLLFNPLMILV